MVGTSVGLHRYWASRFSADSRLASQATEKDSDETEFDREKEEDKSHKNNYNLLIRRVTGPVKIERTWLWFARSIS